MSPGVPHMGYIYLSLLDSPELLQILVTLTAEIKQLLSFTSRYLDDLLNTDNIYCDQMVDRIYPTELQLNKASSSDSQVKLAGRTSALIPRCFILLTVLRRWSRC